MLRPAQRSGNWRPALALLAVGCIIVHAISAYLVLDHIARGEEVSDWVAFYSGATIVRDGHQSHLYSLGFQELTQRAMFGNGHAFDLYALPAFVATALAPLSTLSFSASYFVWLAMNLLMLAWLLRLAWRCLAEAPPSLRIAFVGLAAVATPTTSVLLLGQMDFLALVGLAGCYALLERRRPFAAGSALAMALVKPYLVIPALALLGYRRQWRAVAGFSVFGGALLLVPPAVYGPRLALDQVLVLRSERSAIASQRVHEEMMVNMRGLVTSVSGTHDVWVWALPLALVATVATWQAFRLWRDQPVAEPQAWALAFVLPLIASPHVHMQSMVLLLAAWALYVRSRVRHGLATPVEWVLLAFVLMTASWLLSIAGINGIALLVVAAFGIFAWRWPVADAAALLSPARIEPAHARPQRRSA